MKRPPLLLRLVGTLLVHGSHRDVILGDLEEEYATVDQTLGVMAAVRSYLRMAITSARDGLNPWHAQDARTERARSSKMESVLTDIRQGVRALAHRPVMSIVIVVTLALATGATTSMFSIVDGVLLKSLPFVDQDRLMTIWLASSKNPTDRRPTSSPDFRSWRAQAQSFAGMASYRSGILTLTGHGEAHDVTIGRVSEGFFDVLRAPLLMGRAISATEATLNGPARVVISESFWRTELGSARDVLGKTLQLNNQAYEIIGVARDGLSFPDNAEAWVAEQPNESQCGWGCVQLSVIGRLASGATVVSAQKEMKAIAGANSRDHIQTNRDVTTNVVPLADLLLGAVRLPLFVLLGAVLLVMLIACANIANLLFANAAGRTSEFAVRKALGAGTFRLSRQLITESLLLSAAGCCAGLLLARWCIGLLVLAVGNSVPRMAGVQVDGGVLLFSLALLVLCTLLFGLAPALSLARTDLSDAMRGARAAAGTVAATRRRATLITMQVALSVMLLIGTGLLLRSFLALSTVNPGFDASRVESFSVALPEATYKDFDARIRFFATLRERLATLPGVERVATVVGAPLGNIGFGSSFDASGLPPAEPGKELATTVRIVSPDYFETLRIPIVAGRAITTADATNATRVIVVSKGTAAWLWPGRNPLGQNVTLNATMGMPENTPRTVVGVAADVRSFSLEELTDHEMYIPHAQAGTRSMSVLIRTRADAGDVSVLQPARAILRAMDAGLPMRHPENFSTNIDQNLARPRLYSALLMTFAGLAVALAAIGLYGLVAFQLAHRRRELGIRMAIGASSRDLTRSLVRGGMVPALAGLIIGLPCAWFATRIITSLLFGVASSDPTTWIGVPLIMLTLCIIVTTIPARRAGRIHPREVLTTE